MERSYRSVRKVVRFFSATSVPSDLIKSCTPMRSLTLSAPPPSHTNEGSSAATCPEITTWPTETSAFP